MTLKKQAFSAIRWTSFSLFTRAFLQFAQIAILARILTPADFGLAAIVTSIMAFLQIFADAGISNAIIHHQKISNTQQSSLYWLNVCATSVLAIALMLFSGLLATWYEQPNLDNLITLAALAMIASSIGLQLRLKAQKSLNFSPLAKVDISAAFAGFICAITSAFFGFGVYSLLISALITSILSSLLSWIYLSDGWRPLIRLKMSEIREFLQFGGYMMANNLANSLNSQIDVLLGGKMMSAQAIGQYSIAKSLNLNIAMIVNPIVTQVGLPIMAQAQNDPALLKRIYLQTMLMTASINFPIYIFLIFFAPEVVALYLGESWTSTIPLMQIFAAWALLRSTGNPVGSLLMAKGRADLSFKWNLTWLFITPLAIWLGSHYGATGMATSMVLLGLIGYWPNWFFLVKQLSGISFTEYSCHLLKPLLISLFAVIVSYWSVILLTTPVIRVAFSFLISSAIYLVLSFYLNQQWFRTMMEFLKGK
jgi:lipopolysaccharide exporter